MSCSWDNRDYEAFDGPPGSPTFMSALSQKRRKAVRQERKQVWPLSLTTRPSRKPHKGLWCVACHQVRIFLDAWCPD